MFSVVCNIDGLVRKFDTLADSAADLERPLRMFGSYLRKKALARYKAQDFPGLATSTIEKRAQKGLRTLERKLNRDLRKAIGRARVEDAPKGILGRLFGRNIPDPGALETRGVKSRIAVLAEFQKRHRPQGELAARTGLKPLSIKQLASLGNREDRAVAKAVGGPILGRLPQSLVVTVGEGSVTLESRTHEKWTEAHNKGGAVGHGAVLPKRETVKVDATDLDVLGEILVEHHLLLAFTPEAA
jgi:hypothetical protein